jgi:SAM-dependent methyltransferase
MAPGDQAMSRTTFDHVATEYDAARPDYPASLYDVLESALGQPLLRADVLDVGAGTGIATRALAGRGARVVAVDPGPVVLELLRARSTSRVRPVLGDGNDLPLRDGSIDLVTYAQSWHWTDPVRSVPEAARVLHDRGVLAVWWNFLMADGEPWFEDFTARNEASTPTYHRSHRGVDYGVPMRESGLFGWVRPVEIPWQRTVSVDAFVTDQSSHSHVAAQSPGDRDVLLGGLRAGLLDAFPDGVAELPYATRVWVCRR